MAGSGGVVTHTLDRTLINNAGSVVTHTRDLSLTNNAGGVVTHTRGTNSNIGFRGPQIRAATLAPDRFAKAPTSALVSDATANLTATGQTTVYTVPTGKMAIVQGCIILINVADTVTTDAEVSFGASPSTDNIFSSEILVQIRSVNDVYSFWSDKTTSLILNSGESLQIDVVTAATAAQLYGRILVVGSLI